MKLSVLIATYNYGRYIEAAIRSVLDQQLNVEQFEIVVVDGGSRDETGQILSSYLERPNFKLIQQQGRGLANACNQGIRECKGEYIIRLDADDLFLPHILLIESLFLDHNPNVDFVYSDYVMLLEQSGRHLRKRLPAFDPEELRGRGDFLCGGTMYRKEILDSVGGYDERFETLVSYDLILRLLKVGRMGFHVPLPLFAYRIHEQSMSTHLELVEQTGRLIAEMHGQTYSVNRYNPRNIIYADC